MNLLSIYSAFILCFQREELAILRCPKEMNQVSYIIWYDMKATVNVLCYHEGEAECAVATICCLVASFVLTKGTNEQNAIAPTYSACAFTCIGGGNHV